MTTMRPTRHQGQSAINQDAADGGYWHQRALIEALRHWRADPLGARLALSIFGPALWAARSCGAEPMEDPSAKPDLMAWMVGSDGARIERHISAKLARIGATDSPARPMHHAARVTFEEASEHGLLPESDLEIRSSLLSHFIDGEPLARQDPERAERAMAFLRDHWGLVALSAIEGLGDPRATHVAISLAQALPDGSLRLAQTRTMPSSAAIALLSREAPTMSDPREGQVGTLGSRWMHIQRGQALSLGPQRDIQIKINAGALFLAASALPELDLG
jgi:hypothetical protein